MKYALLIYEAPQQLAKRNGPEAGAYWAAWSAFNDTVKSAGVMTGGAGLQPPTTATTLRLDNGRRVVQDGPYADSKEQLGGFYILDLPDLDKALDWAAKLPATGGTIEIRPLLEM